MEKLKTILEGILFLCGDEGIGIEQLMTCLQEEQESTVQEALDSLHADYQKDNHGIELVFYGGLYKFVSKADVYPYAMKLFSSTKVATISNAALETLAIIAYKQPITRSEIEEIRGVGCDMMLRKLLARNLICELGRSDAPGRPFLYEVTKDFLDSFKLESLKELPDLPAFEEAEETDLFDFIPNGEPTSNTAKEDY